MKPTDTTLSEHFKLSEFVKSSTAQARGLDNTPPAAAVDNLRNLCQQVLEPLRRWADRPVSISSGYRSAALNSAVGGSPRSQHLTGEAADLRVPSMERGWLWFCYLRDHLPYDQLIWEHQYGCYWIHVSLRAKGQKNRKQVIVF